MYSEHQKEIFLQTELHIYKLLSYSWSYLDQQEASE